MKSSTRLAIERAIGNAEALPALPASLAQLLRALDSDASLQEISALVARDVALTTRVLRIANGSLFAHLGAPVTTATQAVSRLGLSELRGIALAMAVIGALAPRKPSRQLHYPEFWLHCATSANAMSALIARVKTAPARAADDTFLAALVHDVGIPVLARSLGDRYDGLLAENAASEEPLFVTEMRALGFHHGEVGAVALETWGMPLAARQAAQWHHEPLVAPANARQLAGWVHVADWMTHTLGHGAPADGALSAFDDETWDLLGITFEVVRDATEDFAAAAEKSREIISAAL